ncbi:MAG: antibiotic biosynthesis monooxygenase family protein [Acidimicrobiia bacterium]
MSIVRINAVTVPAERASEFEQRFAARAGEVSKADGFEAFELLKPTDERDVYLVYTRWTSRADFEAWVNSAAFQHGHKAHSSQGPVGTDSELWAFDVLQREDGPS